MLATHIEPQQLMHIKANFEALDKDRSGLLNYDELKAGFKDLGLPKADVHAIIQNADYMGNKKINYTEFLASTMSV